MKKRYVFDLDETLLTADWTKTDQYFVDKYGDDAKPFLDNMGAILRVYERTFSRYTYEDLSSYLKSITNLDISPSDVKKWDELVSFVKDTEESHVRETLEYLKNQGCSLAVLTNWFGDSQINRLNNAGLIDYFDAVFSGDIITKPHKEAYWMATAGYDHKDCVFIGDDIDTDYVGPKACGMDAIVYDKDNKHHKTLIKIRDFKELKK